MDVPMVVGEKGMQVRNRETVRSAGEQSERESEFNSCDSVSLFVS